jgi:hypothetical protein
MRPVVGGVYVAGPGSSSGDDKTGSVILVVVVELLALGRRVAGRETAVVCARGWNEADAVAVGRLLVVWEGRTKVAVVRGRMASLEAQARGWTVTPLRRMMLETMVGGWRGKSGS